METGAVYRLTHLSAMHPRLLWDDVMVAAAVVLRIAAGVPPVSLSLRIEDVLDFGTADLTISISAGDLSEGQILRIQRTYEPSRLVELAAIAVAGIVLYHAGGHEIADVSVRGSGSDYLVGRQRWPMEVAGRSRRADFETAWQQRIDRLRTQPPTGFFLCVSEFESPFTRLSFVS